MNKISIIAAISSKDRGLGKDGDLLWKIDDDLKRFKEITMGHPIIMGRKTFEAIGRALPGRENIVITRNTDYQAEGVTIVHSFEEAIDKGQKHDEEIFIIGGGQIYQEALPIADKLYLTLIDGQKDSDTFFPDYAEFNKEGFKEEHLKEGLKYTFLELEKE